MGSGLFEDIKRNETEKNKLIIKRNSTFNKKKNFINN